MFDNEGYLGFTFAGHHSSEFGLTVVSDGSRYHQNLVGNFSDTVTSVSGKNGGYYFGTQIQMRDFNINCAFDNMTTHTRNRIQTWLYPNKVGWLVYDEMPYKKYLVKISGVPTFNFLPFDNSKITQRYKIEQEILKGELNISFFSFNEYGFRNEEYEIPNIYKDSTIAQQVIDSGIIPDNYIIDPVILSNKKPKTINANDIFSIYNSGNGISEADFYFTISVNSVDVDPIQITNLDDNKTYIINNFKSNNKILKKTKDNGFFRIEILGTKKEVWVTCLDGNKNIVSDSRFNIGAYHNHYFPKVYHKKPTDIMLVTQSKNDKNQTEPLFYPFSYIIDDYHSSDSKSNNDRYAFEEFKQYWSDYTVCTQYSSYFINNVINPSTLFIHLQGVRNELEEENLIYLIYPNKFKCNKDIIDFVPVYEDTYI